MVGYGGERGLLGLAFHPSYKTNGAFYVNWTLKSGDAAVNAVQGLLDEPRRGRPDQLAAAPDHRPAEHEPQRRHARLRATDGYLYIGDGRRRWRRRPEQQRPERQRAARQDPADQRQRHDRRQPVPDPGDNPYVGRTGRDEIWSFGLRNPWRFSFDRATGDLWIGDVGQDRGTRRSTASTSASSGYGRGRQLRLAGDGGSPLLHPVERLQHDRQAAAGRRVHATRRVAR